MKKVYLIIAFLAIITAILGLSSCEDKELEYKARYPISSDEVYFSYFLWDEEVYFIKSTNVAERTVEDNCGEMIDVIIPTEYNGKPVTEIGWDSFRGCKILRSVTIPEGISGIHSYTFFDCDALESVHLPKSMSEFSPLSFASCNSLREVTVDPDNPWFCSVDGVVYTKDMKKLVFYPAGKLDEEYSILEGCEIISYDALTYCENLKRIYIPASVTEATLDASYRVFIGYGKGLEAVVVDENNSVYSSIDGNLYSKDGKTLLRVCVSTEDYELVIPEGVEKIAEWAAISCHNITSVTLPSSLVDIDRYAFYMCDNLTQIIIPKRVKHIGESAFSYCDRLSSVKFEETKGWTAVSPPGKFQAPKKRNVYGLGSPRIAAEYLLDEYSYWEWCKEN